MKKKLRRSLLLFALILVLCPVLQGCTKTTDVSNVVATFDDRTIIVSSPEDNTFKLNIEIETNSNTSSWTSGNLSITKASPPQTYDIETLIANYVSQDSRITSVSVEPAEIEDLESDVSLGVIIAFIIGCIFGLCVYYYFTH